LTTFDGFGLAEPISRALAEENYVTPTPIQAHTVPLVLEGRDVVGIAQTGTGKTAAFALPILHRLSANRTPPERKSCRVLVLSPTRELSGQILESFNAYGRHLGLRTALAIGGVSMGKQVRDLMNGVDVLVATPGRLLDLVQSNALRLNRVEVLVLDEADRMLDMGFIDDIRRIVVKLPPQRQTLLFSATMPKAIADLAEHMLRNPAKVAVAPVASTAERVTQRVIHIERAGKPTVLTEILREQAMERAIVFTRTKRGADKLVRTLAQARIAAQALHGNKSQPQRERVLAGFRDGETRVLVATDIAARGIDVDGISHVVNYDVPNEPESYVHRIGRTARAGAAGTAISLCDHDEVPYVRAIEKLIRMSLPATDRRSSPGRSLDPAPERQEGSRRPHRGRRGAPQHQRSAAQEPRSQEPRSQEPRSQEPRSHGPRPNGARPAETNGHRGHANRGHENRGPANRGPANRGHANRGAADRGPANRGPAHQGPANSQPSHVQRGPEDLSGVGFLHRAREPRRAPQSRPQR
jgi:ATP-dependent RNA helicase RhlE